jgi:hypothetical protein
MSVQRILAATSAALLLVPAPASAQFFWKSPNMSDAPVVGDEPGIGLPGATPEENRAALVWNLRAALNVAALQCGFAPTLLTETNYNSMLKYHSVELKNSFDTLGKYFTRINGKSKPKGQNALDQFGTRIYSSYSSVGGQFMFCQTAHSIGRDAIFASRGKLIDVSRERIRELRKSVLPSGEQRFGAYQPREISLRWLPSTEKRCWKGKEWNASKCGNPYPAAATTAVASR